MSAEDLDDLRDDVLPDERPQTKQAAEAFLDELRRRGIIEED